MTAFNGRTFVLGIEHLDAASRQLYERHGSLQNGRWTLIEQVVDEAMVRLAGNAVDADSHAIDRQR